MTPGRLCSLLFFCIAANTCLPAQASFNLGKLDTIIEYFYQEARSDSFTYYCELRAKHAQQMDSLAMWIESRLDVSDYHHELGEYDAWAMEVENTWSRLWRQPKDDNEWYLLCLLQCDRGKGLAKSGKILQAITNFQQAAENFERFRHFDFDAVEFIYKPLGNCYTRLGDNDKALAVFFKALLLTNDNETLAGLYCNIGIAYWNKGDYNAAEQYLRQSLALPEVSSLKRALLLGALAQTQLDKGQLSQAARSSAESLALLRKETPTDVALEYRCYARTTAGLAKIRLGKYAEAEQLLLGAAADARTGFGIHSRELGKVGIARAELALKQQRLEQAMDEANKALSAVLPGFRPITPAQNPDIVTLYEENVIFHALSLKAAAAKLLYEKTGDLTWLKLALECHEIAGQAESRLRKIFQYNSSKLDLQTSARARETSAMRVLRVLYEKTGQELYLEKAFALAEKSKAALLLEALQENLIRQRLSEKDIRFAALNGLQQSLSHFEKQILLYPEHAQINAWRSESDALLSQIVVLKAEIEAAYPNLAAVQSATLQEAAQGLDPSEALVAYFVGPEHIERFILQKGKAANWASLAYDGDLQVLADKFLTYFSSQQAILNDPSGYLNTAFLLRQKLLPTDLPTAEHLTIVPDGFINFIPFDALLSSAPATGSSLRNAPYLIQQKTLRYAWSCGVLRQQRDICSKAANYALNLAPGFSQGERGLAPLITAASERPSGCQNLLNEAATLEGFMDKMSQFRVLHLSTHAFASATDGQLPRLELYDQPLYLPSIYALPLQADLVTLSACQTGLGQSRAGEGVMSLARAFAQAGAACVVSSLWSVNDRSTSQLLSNFYQALEQGQPIGQALRKAKLQYLNDPGIRATMQSPYFWAGLSMVGDDRVVAAGGSGAWWYGGLGLLVLALGYLWAKKRKALRL